MRPLIQYDLDEPPSPQATTSLRRPPAKKRKRNQRNSRQYQPPQHWDDPGSSPVGMVYDEQEGSAAPPALNLVVDSVKVSARADDMGEEEEEEDGEEMMEGGNIADTEGDGDEEEEESTPLTHDEIWDDTALVDAWNAASAEYEAYHGPSKDWKTDSVKMSSLWYDDNKPYVPPHPGPGKRGARANTIPPEKFAAQEKKDGLKRNIDPLDFLTSVPTHDPSLAIPSDGTGTNPAATTVPSFVPPASMAAVTRDEAFNNALSATYWSGYWTAVYHCQTRQTSGDDDNVVDATEQNGAEIEDLVQTQR